MKTLSTQETLCVSGATQECSNAEKCYNEITNAIPETSILVIGAMLGGGTVIGLANMTKGREFSAGFYFGAHLGLIAMNLTLVWRIITT